MTALEPINPESLGAPKGYSNGILVKGDADLLFIAGQVAWAAGQKIETSDFVLQFGRALDNVLAVVREAGGLAEHVARFVFYVTDKHEYLARAKDLGAAYRARMGKHFPAMALVEVKGLLDPSAKIEIEATAALPRDRSTR